MINPKFKLADLTPIQKQLRLDILQTSFERQLSHLGSCLTAADAIEAVYQIKNDSDIFVLSNGHAGIAWYQVLAKRGLIDQKQLKTIHIHPDRNPENGIKVSTGSLGQGLPIAVGMALADRSRQIFCMISDGECTEGSIWEAVRFASEQQLHNLTILLNFNGWAAYAPTSYHQLLKQFGGFDLVINEVDGHNLVEIKKALQKTSTVTTTQLIVLNTTVEQLPFLHGQDAHYYVMSTADWELSKKLLA